MPPATRSRGSVPDVSREGLRGRRVPCPRSCCALGAGALSAAGPRRTGDCRAPPAGLCSFVGRSRRLRAHSPLPAHPSGHGGEPLQLPGAPCHPLPAVALRLTRLPRPGVRSSPPFAPAGVAPPGPLPPSFPHSHALSETAPLSPIPAPSILPFGFSRLSLRCESENGAYSSNFSFLTSAEAGEQEAKGVARTWVIRPVAEEL